MIVIPPISITDAVRTSSTVAEPSVGETSWNSATNYVLGTVVTRTTTHRLYRNLIPGVSAVIPESAPLTWEDVGPNNCWAMFDLLRNSQTISSSPITVVLTPGRRIDSLAILGLIATQVTINMTVASVNVYSRTVTLNERETTSWKEYYFGIFATRPSLILLDLPPYVGGVITIVISGGSTVKCGACVMGTQVDIGDIQYDAESDVLNFSLIERDSFGGAKLIPRRNVPKTNQELELQRDRVNKVRAVREILNAAPAVWAGIVNSDNGYFESLLILGIYKKFSIRVRDYENAFVSLELEEI